MGAGTSVIAGYIGGKLRGKSKKPKPSKHRIRNASRKASIATKKSYHEWKKKRSERKKIE